MAEINIDFKEILPFVIEAFTEVYGKEYKDIIFKKITNAIIIPTYSPDSIKQYILYIKSCKRREYAVKFLSQIGIDVNEYTKDNYTQPLDDKVEKILEYFIGSSFEGFGDNRDYWAPLHAFKMDNKTRASLLLINKIKIINFLLSKQHELIDENNFALFAKTKEYCEILKKIDSFNKIYEQLFLEYKKWEEKLKPYEEYVESWVHEAKTPLALFTMILDNRADELPSELQVKLDYVCNQLQEDIAQMLYYARLKSSTKDYRFEELDLQALLKDVLTDYELLLEEKHFVIKNEVKEERVFTDRRGLQFMLGQIISNVIKYSTDSPMLIISTQHTVRDIILSITDNGSGVKSYDLPYIFQKGFTGDSTSNRNKATGMGLYLTKKMADDLNLRLDVESEYNRFFKISIFFPVS